MPPRVFFHCEMSLRATDLHIQYVAWTAISWSCSFSSEPGTRAGIAVSL